MTPAGARLASIVTGRSPGHEKEVASELTRVAFVLAEIPGPSITDFGRDRTLPGHVHRVVPRLDRTALPIGGRSDDVDRRGRDGDAGALDGGAVHIARDRAGNPAVHRVSAP